MKRIMVFITVLVVVATLFAGCAPSDAPSLTPDQTTPETTPTPGSTTPDATPTPGSTAQPSSPGASTGTLTVLVTDAPKYDVTRVDVTVSEVQVHKAGDDGESGDWITLAIQEETFNLLDLQNGLTMLLAEGEVESGKYTQLRMTVFEVLVDYDDVVGKKAIVPSDKLKFVRPFTLEAGEEITLIVDIDAAKSVVVTGASKDSKDKVLFKPVVKLLIWHEEALGTIAGTVTDDNNPIEDAEVIVEDTTLLATTDGNGDYTIADVPVGTYTVTASAEGYESASQDNVEVSEDATSTVNFALEPSP